MKKISWILVSFLGVFLIYISFTYFPQLKVANGYAAKKMCSCIFIAGRTHESIQNEDLAFGPLSMTSTKVDRENKSVQSSIFGLSPRTAVYREDVGCILLVGKDDYNIRLKLNRPPVSNIRLWPHGNQVRQPVDSKNFNPQQLKEAIRSAFDPSLDMDSLKTRAVVVVHNGQIVAEKYAHGFDADTEILGWSMTKSITATLIGIMVKNKRLSLNDKALFTEWYDERAEIRLIDMVQMQSGLSFDEDYSSLSDATKMLYTQEDVSRIPLSKMLRYPPGSHWAYSSGTTNLLSRFLRAQFDTHEDYLRFPYDSLFTRIGMRSAVMETDESGTFIGSSYTYATPRDWARLGLLYLKRGNWFGDQVIDSSWVDFVRTPAPVSDYIYGGQFWLNAQNSAYPDVPADLFSCNGFQGQFVFVIPSQDLVIVRMGLAEAPVFDINHFLKEIIASFEAPVYTQ